MLALDIFLLAKAIFQQNFVPIVPIIAGALLAAGLLLIVKAEGATRDSLRAEHRRLTRVAHQLESPLRALQDDFSHLVQKADRLPADQRLQIKRMDTKTKVLLENIRDVFLMLRAEQGSIAQDARAYDVCALVNEAIDRVKGLASARNVEITTTNHCQDAPVTLDRSLFLIALTHLLENAILYNLTPGIVNVAVTRGKTTMRIIVQDRGIGIKDSDAPAIFLPYARGHKADQYDPDGIGVGLTLAQHIIQEFNGTITWQNRPTTTGTEFTIKLPLTTST